MLPLNWSLPIVFLAGSSAAASSAASHCGHSLNFFQVNSAGADVLETRGTTSKELVLCLLAPGSRTSKALPFRFRWQGSVCCVNSRQDQSQSQSLGPSSVRWTGVCF